MVIESGPGANHTMAAAGIVNGENLGEIGRDPNDSNFQEEPSPKGRHACSHFCKPNAIETQRASKSGNIVLGGH